MNPIQAIFDILFIFIFPVMIGLAFALFHFFAQRLPSHQRQALEQFSRIAVESVCREFPNAPNHETLAKAKVMALFGAFRLPIPSDIALEIAIKAAFYEAERQ